jgi:FSR family fosmidomycin resistance protein-like MFS transporter
LKRSGRELGIVLSVISLRSASYTGLLALLPLFFHARGISNIASSRILTLMLATGAIGGVAGGFISDRWGRKPLIVGSLVAATPLFAGFLATQGALSMILLALAGACLLAALPAAAGLAGLLLRNNAGRVRALHP